jgi:hypothetical protein
MLGAVFRLMAVKACCVCAGSKTNCSLRKDRVLDVSCHVKSAPLPRKVKLVTTDKEVGFCFPLFAEATTSRGI